MKTNTVVLSLKDYNDLKEFKKKMEEGYTYKIPQPHVFRNVLRIPEICLPINYITTDETVIELLEKNKELLKIIEMNDKCFNTLNKVKKMSIWEFIKWRKNYQN